MGQKVWLFVAFEAEEKVSGAKTSDTWTRPSIHPCLAVSCELRGAVVGFTAGSFAKRPPVSLRECFPLTALRLCIKLRAFYDI